MYNPDKYKATRVRPLQARGKERVRQILSAALTTFKTHGIERVTTNDIAQAAQIPIGSLYRYYPNKDAIVTALTELYVDDLSALFAEVGDHQALRYLSWDEVLLLMVGSWVTYARLNGSFPLLYTVRASPPLAAKNRELLDTFTAAFVAVLRKRCPAVTDRQGFVCFTLCMAAAEMGISDQQPVQGAPDMYHDAVGAAALYMLRQCGSCEHRDGDILG
jgi:AcrR family transcriptional regulator